MLLEPRKALNKAFLKIKPNRTGIELFKQNLILLLDSIKEKESEEFHKNLISDFLKNTYYSPNHFINTKKKNDLVIHIGKEAKSNVGVIIEAKSPSNKAEMLSQKNINSKALQELVLYYLDERILNKNLDIKHLVATNLNEWFIFDEHLFEKQFAQNKSFVKQFENFKASKKSTDVFYKEIAKPYIDTVLDKLEYTYFDLASYDKILRNSDKLDDAKLIVLYKLLSPEHLLKLSFANDSNSLDKNFYNELLHLIGLTETKEGGKKLIERPKAGQRNAGSLLENVINQLDSLDKLSRLTNVKQYGDTHEERLFTVGLELCITWVNRILFLKLLEAQLISYHKGDKSYAFLHKGLLHDYDNLNALFFMVLAKKPEERNDRVKTLFAKVPYLNSSLFEPTELEHQTLFIAGLEDDIPLQLLGGTVIKDANGKKLTGTHKAIDYFFDFLDAYDFASEGSEEIQEDNKTLINASVLGLIFEKINGYKDGSFYTPSFITMYMCKETIRRAVVQKFNETKGWNCEDFDALYNKIEDTKEANTIINSVKICDPAVGSGHFLVSALNEMIAIKHDLKVLVDREGKRLKEYQVDIVNDELIVTDEDGLPFTYNPKSKESQRLQETLFHEKQTIIENCLFGVDINPNSVKICRLRLWIELLKNAYYRNETELETLPNIDINIKCGNSLIARFGLDADLKKALKQSKWNIESYKLAVATYRNAESKEQKREMEQLIADIKGNFRSEISQNDPIKTKLDKLVSELYHRFTGNFLFEPEESYGSNDKKLEKERKKQKEELEKQIQKYKAQLEEIKSNKIYENAFEWRFEFPEVLNDEGDFVGFDVIIGNPPYIGLEEFDDITKEIFRSKYELVERKYDTSILFVIHGLKLLRTNSLLCYIAPPTWQTGENYSKLREKLFLDWGISKIINLPFNIFSDAYVDTCIYVMTNKKTDFYDIHSFSKDATDVDLNDISFTSINTSLILQPKYKIILNPKVFEIINRLDKINFKSLDEISISTQGLSPSAFQETLDSGKYVYPFLKTGNAYNYTLVINETFNTSLENKVNLMPFYDEGDKILIRRIINRQDRLTVGFTDKKIVFKKDINPFLVKNNDFKTKYVLAILASKFISHLYINISSIALKDDFRQTTLTELRELLIPKIKINEQQLFIDKVDQILLLKKDNPEADTSALEREIDFMVYSLYGLSEEEIGIVEGS
ncbi:Eco57I restriction-modification methylase domain-containing protein [Flavobacterium sp.]|jgi:adenine-specific DNA-methyltransferase|uniref:type IIG restriction enzyme/methyltransferase n=1 Tax=Flavobacterium sp. TaxID=239 RepID=UPI0037844BBA